ncbi:N-acetylmuramoyl-L-alanine amidase [Neobacillus cucumis]|uniref:N-acetylmuramoyl-L-alanine amidase n=1 Tax=Neobacillus cucumis TaxID=1740721 RepID=UPI002E2482A3|nr:N-acetylmuramoyl-L-alanine amidase [Neobacillus cucumis]MED4224797.1 N-acetylmuramoyl-L-alanine amidase [Neobacillus cucumis]
MITTKIKNKSLIKVLAIISVAIVPFLQSQNATYAHTSSSQVTVTASSLNVREAADISSSIINHVHLGDTFEVIQKRNNWDQIKLSSNQTGWVSNAYLTPAENKEAIVEAPSLNVRAKPSLFSSDVGYLKFGTKITIQMEHDGWAKMVAPSGVSGWVNKDYITKDKSGNQPAISSSPSQKTTSVITDKKSLPKSTESSANQSIDKTAQNTKNVQNGQEPLKGKIIVLDPGHGGKDNGATSYVGTHEKTLTLETAKIVEQKLEKAGANVIMTRSDDTFIPLEQRAAIANQNHADAFISFHYNCSNDPSVHGITDFYYNKSKDSDLASDILNEVIKITNLNNLGMRFDNLSVLRNNLRPSTLIELGFLSSKQDDPIVESSAYREEVAQGVYLGLLDYFSK